MPRNTSAACDPETKPGSFVLCVNDYSIEKKASAQIKVRVFETPNAKVIFSISPENNGGSIAPSSCNTDGNTSKNAINECSVYFDAAETATEGIFTITAFGSDGKFPIASVNIEVKGGKGTSTDPKIECEKDPKKIWNSLTQICSDKPSVETCKAAGMDYDAEKKICKEKVLTEKSCEDQGKVLNEEKTACVTNTDTTYTPLAPLPGLPEGIAFETDPDINSCPFGKYLNIIIKLVIGFAAVLAMVMIVAGGIEYMTSELVSSKEAGKETIKNAILGLLIALGSYLILNTINPQLLSVCLDKLPEATIVIEETPESSSPFTPISKDKLTNLGVTCPGSGGKGKLIEIATSFNNKVYYNQDKRGTISDNKIYLDCSSFIIQVYKCAGLNLSGTYTGNIFNETYKNKINSDGTKIEGDGNLNIGDLFGWKPGENNNIYGHIMMYSGNGKYIDVHGGDEGRSGKAVNLSGSITKYIKIINYIIPAP
ncbi:MAG: hypothetical protein UT09_C0004G0003 [Parcubacteria group bacterium GW2011_GWF2_38_8]|nr:MAG: hypothetical protein UT09_C0004G0003 [Parcubacteria group bacterium GW2011_GWF2_38_8]